MSKKFLQTLNIYTIWCGKIRKRQLCKQGRRHKKQEARKTATVDELWNERRKFMKERIQIEKGSE